MNGNTTCAMFGIIEQQYTICLNVFFVEYQSNQEKRQFYRWPNIKIWFKTMHRKNRSQTWWPAATNDLELWTGALGHKMWPGLKSWETNWWPGSWQSHSIVECSLNIFKKFREYITETKINQISKYENVSQGNFKNANMKKPFVRLGSCDDIWIL